MALKIIFMGTPKFAVPILKAINESDHKILGVYTQPAAKSGRGKKLNHSDIFHYFPLKRYCRKLLAQRSNPSHHDPQGSNY